MVCPECGAANVAGADRCGQCGADLVLSAHGAPRFMAAGRAGPYAVRPLAGTLVGVALILPLALAGYVEAESDLRLAPVPLVIALLLAIAGFEVLLRATGRDPQRQAERRLRRLDEVGGDGRGGEQPVRGWSSEA